MNISIKHIILLLLFLSKGLGGYAQNLSKFADNIEKHIFLEEFELAKTKINKQIKGKIGNEDKAELFYLLGYISKLEGNIYQALMYWQKSNKYRSKAFPHGNYHLAWNYALISNYHYEKINTKLAVEYADSCLQLIAGLTLKQQQEIEIFKIWNILGQSYKQDIKGLTAKQTKKKYKQIQAFYLKSVNFIQTNKLEKHYLAQTYHLLGNSYTDLTWFDISAELPVKNNYK